MVHRGTSWAKGSVGVGSSVRNSGTWILTGRQRLSKGEAEWSGRGLSRAALAREVLDRGGCPGGGQGADPGLAPSPSWGPSPPRGPGPLSQPSPGTPRCRPPQVGVPWAFWPLYHQTFQRRAHTVGWANALDFIFPFVDLVGLFCSVSLSLPHHSWPIVPLPVFCGPGSCFCLEMKGVRGWARPEPQPQRPVLFQLCFLHASSPLKVVLNG